MDFGAVSSSFQSFVTSFEDIVVPKSGDNLYGSVSDDSSIIMTVPRAEMELICFISNDGRRAYALSSATIDAQEFWVVPDTVLES